MSTIKITDSNATFAEDKLFRFENKKNKFMDMGDFETLATTYEDAIYNIAHSAEVQEAFDGWARDEIGKGAIESTWQARELHASELTEYFIAGLRELPDSRR